MPPSGGDPALVAVPLTHLPSPYADQPPPPHLPAYVVPTPNGTIAPSETAAINAQYTVVVPVVPMTPTPWPKQRLMMLACICLFLSLIADVSLTFSSGIQYWTLLLCFLGVPLVHLLALLFDRHSLHFVVRLCAQPATTRPYGISIALSLLYNEQLVHNLVVHGSQSQIVTGLAVQLGIISCLVSCLSMVQLVSTTKEQVDRSFYPLSAGWYFIVLVCTVVVSVFLNNVGLFGVYSVIVAQSTMMLLALFLPHIPGLVAVSVVSGAMKFFVQIMYFVMQPSYSSVYSYMVILCQALIWVTLLARELANTLKGDYTQRQLRQLAESSHDRTIVAISVIAAPICVAGMFILQRSVFTSAMACACCFHAVGLIFAAPTLSYAAFGMFLVGFIETIKLFYSGGNLLDMLAICAVLLAPVVSLSCHRGMVEHAKAVLPLLQRSQTKVAALLFVIASLLASLGWGLSAFVSFWQSEAYAYVSDSVLLMILTLVVLLCDTPALRCVVLYVAGGAVMLMLNFLSIYSPNGIEIASETSVLLALLVAIASMAYISQPTSSCDESTTVVVANSFDLPYNYQSTA